MPDITAGDWYKIKYRLALHYLRKEFTKGRDKDAIHDDIESCGNKTIRKLYKIICKTADNIKHVYQGRMIREASEILLWATAYKDTAYRDPFFWALKHILDMKDDIYDDVLKYYKEPEDWYINAWKKSKDNSLRLQEDGKIPKTVMSPDELAFVPEHQIQQMEKHIKKEQRRRGW